MASWFNLIGVRASIGEGNGTPLQYSCLENPMDGGAWWAAVHGVAKSQTRLSDFTFTFHFHALEKEMATHSSVLAWRIPGMGSLLGCYLWGLTELDTTEVDLATILYDMDGPGLFCLAAVDVFLGDLLILILPLTS